MALTVGFLAKQIMRSAMMSDAAGRKKYRYFFIESTEYAKYKQEVDTILLKLGYGNVLDD